VVGFARIEAIAGYFLFVKLMPLPAIGHGLDSSFGLPHLQLQILVTFCALPTVSSAYVLATRMGGNGPFVAFVVSASTLQSALNLPIWLAPAH